MQEDPAAKRNRGSRTGLWFLLGLAALVGVLIGADFLKPAPLRAAAPAEPPALTMKQRVAADQVADGERDRARRSAPRED